MHENDVKTWLANKIVNFKVEAIQNKIQRYLTLSLSLSLSLSDI